MPNYSMWILEYAYVPDFAVGAVLDGQHNKGVMTLTFGYLVLKGENHTILIDTGYDPADGSPYIQSLPQRENPRHYQSPERILAKVGLHPDEVDTVLLTHAHFDHMGNLPAFKNAHFFLQKRELSDWIWAMSLPKRYETMRVGVNPHDLDYARQLVDQGQMTLLDGDVDNLLPGISLHSVFDSHTFASQMVVIENSDGPGAGKWIYVGDLAYVRQNLTGVNNSGASIPVGLAIGPSYNILHAYDQMFEITGGRLERILLGHSTDNWNLYTTWQTADSLHVSEVNLAPGDKSRKA